MLAAITDNLSLLAIDASSGGDVETDRVQVRPGWLAAQNLRLNHGRVVI